MYKRPNLYTSYESETQILPTWTQKALMAFFIIQLFLLPFSIPVLNDDIPGLSWIHSSATVSRCSASSAMASGSAPPQRC